MKRMFVPLIVPLIVSAAGATLAGCGSTAGSPQAATSSGTSTSSRQETSTSTVGTSESESTRGTESRTSGNQTTSSRTSDATSERETSSSRTSDETSDETSTSGAGTLDPDSEKWFVTLCTAVEQVQDLQISAPADADVPEARAAFAEALAESASISRQLSTDLEGLGPPLIEEGEQWQETILQQQGGLADVWERGSETISALPTGTIGDLNDALTEIEQDAEAARQAAGPVPTPSPDIQDAIRAIPECENVF